MAHIQSLTVAVAVCGSEGTLGEHQQRRITYQDKDLREFGHPPAVLQVEEAGDMFLAALLELPALLALRVLNGGLRRRRGLHVLRKYRLRQVAPQPARFVRLLLVLGRHLLFHDLIPVLHSIKQNVLLARLEANEVRSANDDKNASILPWCS